ncbi:MULTISPECIES: DUF4135 domain-containing protein [unclassified Actinomyces]|uniref:DUF4135 domain-containing protein n=1 Tax=unclassified Actinomyces TaxID=2609248 RepID=UPI000D5A0BDB|nr:MULTISPECIES: DUF4135 domain-containing protein [unclassified Actinomyces]RAX22587.1 DUF4135 domain-containing protein [Actinomyces sp. Z3]
MQRLFDRIPGTLDKYFENEIQSALRRAQAAIRGQSVIRVAVRVPGLALKRMLTQRFWALVHKTFVYEMHLFREGQGMPVDSSSTDAFDAYVAGFGVQTLDAWFRKYPELARMVNTMVRRTACFVVEVCEALRDDAERLVAHGLVDGDVLISDMVALDSDPHNGGKVVMALVDSDTKVVVYKPRSLALDVWVHGLFVDVLGNSCVLRESPIPVTLDCGGHGWQRYVHRQGINTETLAAEAYRNLGFASAVFVSIGATDLHDENVIFAGTQPYFVDLETGMRGTNFGDTKNLVEQMATELARSICATSIIPAKMPTVPRSVLVGTINTPYPQHTREEVFTVRNPATDAMDIAKEETVVTRKAEPLRWADGRPADPLPFQQDFVEGYRLGYLSVLERRKAMLKALDSAVFPVRRVLRPTTQYVHMLSAALFPENLVSEDALNMVFEYLRPPVGVLTPDVAGELLKQERQALSDGDVPYFYHYSDDTRLRSGGFISGRAFMTSAIENAAEFIAGMSTHGLLLDERLIGEGFSEICVAMSAYLDYEVNAQGTPMFAKCMGVTNDEDLPYAISERLAELAIHGTGDVKGAGWLCGGYGEKPALYHSEGLVSLHDAGGIVFLLEHLVDCSCADTGRWLTLLDEARLGLRSLSECFSRALEVCAQSIVAGTSSVEFVLNHGARRLPCAEASAHALLARNSSLGDVFGGGMGLALTLPTFPDTPEGLLKNLYGRVSEELALGTLQGDGIAHGRLGALWAMLRLSLRLGDSLGVSRVLDELSEITFPFGWITSGFCNGNAGLLMVAAEAEGTFPGTFELGELAEAVVALPKEDIPIDLSLCHGAAGVLQSLLWAYECTGSSEFEVRARNYWRKALEHARKYGYYTGELHRDYLCGYMLGWAGIADSGLLVSMESKRRWLPLSMASSAVA